MTDEEMVEIAKECDCPSCQAFLVTLESGVLFWEDKKDA